MSSILLNYTHLQKTNQLESFEKSISPIPNSNTGKSEIHIIVILNEKDKLSLKKSKNINLLNSINILQYYFVKVNTDKKLCKINDKSSENTSLILNVLKKNLKGFSIMCYLDIKKDNFKNILNIFIQHQFTEPIIIQDKLCLVHCERHCKTSCITEKVEYALKEYQNPSKSCKLKCKFSPECTKYLKNICNKQFEMGGELYISKMEKDTCIIDVEKNNIVNGTQDSIKIPKIRINFHSHPKAAYKTYNVKYAWPSKIDFQGFFNLRNDTIFHCVSTVEGIYIMYFNEYWNYNLDIDDNIIGKIYNFDDHRDVDPKIVVNKMNNVKHKGYSIINVIFLDWENSLNIFELSFRKFQNSCPISQQMFSNYKKTL